MSSDIIRAAPIRSFSCSNKKEQKIYKPIIIYDDTTELQNSRTIQDKAILIDKNRRILYES